MSHVVSEAERAQRAAQRATFEASISRCVAAGDFVRAFYERFLAASPEVARLFENTDFAKQHAVLKNSLYSMALFAIGLPEGVAHLERIAQRHSRRGLDIPPSLYALWLDTLLQTAREFDSKFDPDIEQAWRSLLGAGIARMIAAHP
jgi:hemoglobin-like flavoprotein